MASSTSSNNDLLHDFFPFIRHYKDGRVERFMGTDSVQPSVDQETGTRSKDVMISPETNVSARLYLPKTATTLPEKDKLPLLVYFHGGGFVVQSPFSALYHRHLNLLVAEANVAAVSVDYRLAPENPIPAAYEDSWLVLKWISDNFREEEWIRDYADLNRVYLGGDSAGGNIAHHMAVRVGSENLDRVNLSGVFLNCPFFWGKEPIGNEDKNPLFPKSYLDRLWHYACPSTVDCDDLWINPGTDPKISGFGSKRVLVYVAERDVLRERGWLYKETLVKSGWDGDIEVVDVEGEDHVFSVTSPTSENGLKMIKRVAAFLNH